MDRSSPRFYLIVVTLGVATITGRVLGLPEATPPRPDEIPVTDQFPVSKPCVEKVAAVVASWSATNDFVLSGKVRKRSLSQFATVSKGASVGVRYSVIDEQAEIQVSLIAPNLETEARRALFSKLNLQALLDSMKASAVTCADPK